MRKVALLVICAMVSVTVFGQGYSYCKLSNTINRGVPFYVINGNILSNNHRVGLSAEKIVSMNALKGDDVPEVYRNVAENGLVVIQTTEVLPVKTLREIKDSLQVEGRIGYAVDGYLVEQDTFSVYSNSIRGVELVEYKTKDYTSLVLNVITYDASEVPGVVVNPNANGGMILKKPVIYLYPEKETEVKLTVNFSGKFTATYPAYEDGWSVMASPSGRLVNKRDGQPYSYLFWEGVYSFSESHYTYTTGFVVPGDSTLAFLQNILPKIGLTPHEYNDFIVFWLPQMNRNKYNFIHFRVGEEYDAISTNSVIPQPTSSLRVFMDFRPMEQFVKVRRQDFPLFKRVGFTLVEWGGMQIDENSAFKIEE